ncbi:DNA-deoxyinosine glycosylase [Erythrobacter alti]|uniref:DNA-deoxyinosine glycosylase n=1 Tax=Erythrobacter alti TaxID=1896145 RepID=UPI0030F42036
MNRRKASFSPATSPDARVLILGSLPGERSLAQRQYYAHPQNRFWHLVGKAISVDLVAMDYDTRLAALRAHGIGLWDVVASAHRTGSLDASIREARPNALGKLVSELPQLRAVCFNGKTSEKIGRPHLADTQVEQISLPSSSPAFAAMPLAEKERSWMGLREFLETPGDKAH